MHGHLNVKIIHIRYCNSEAFTSIKMKLYASRERTALSFTFHKNRLLCKKNGALLRHIYPPRILESCIKPQKFARLPLSIMDYKSFSAYYPVTVNTGCST